MNSQIQLLTKNTFSEGVCKFFYTFCELAALEPIITNLIAIALCLGALLLLKFPEMLPNLGSYHKFYVYGIQGLAAFQIVKSASKSILLPLLAVFCASIGILLNFYSPEFISLHDNFS